MKYRMKKLMQSEDILDKTADQIVEYLLQPSSNEQQIVLCRKCRKKGSGAKAKKYDEEVECCPIERLRELVGNSNASKDDTPSEPPVKKTKSQ